MTDFNANEIKDKIFDYLNLSDDEKKLVSDMVDSQQNLDKVAAVVDLLITLKLDKSSILSYLCFQLYCIDEGKTSQPFEEKLCQADSKMLKSLKQVNNISNLTSSQEADDIRNMFLALSKDVRVVIVKLAGISYDISILNNPLNAENKKLVEQVRDIHIPLSERLGLDLLKLSMDDNVIRLLHPQAYAKIKAIIDQNFDKNERQIALTRQKIEDIFQELNIHGRITSRQKHISSIFKKIVIRKIPYEKIYDLVGIRVIVDTVEECYAVLGKIHAMYEPMAGRFKDYIEHPKPSGYRSLHTTVIADNGSPVELQIRTEEMHRESEFGAPAHWLYKENKKQKTEFDKRVTWLREMIEDSKGLSAQEFVEVLKNDLYGGIIFVQTPKGKVIEFPEGANAIDFAYAIHSDVGNSCIGAKINGKIQPITTKLNNGDIVEIITSSHSKGPSRDWLSVAKTNGARNRIRAFFKNQLKDETIKIGKSLLEEAIKARDLFESQLLTEENIAQVLQRYNMSEIDELYAALGCGNLSTGQVLGKFTTLYNQEKAKSKPTNLKTLNVKTNKDGVLIDGDSGMLIKFAGCCNPIDGDDIVGYISRGKGVIIHQRTCPNILPLEPERIIEAQWLSREETSFLATIKIIADKKEGNLVKFTTVITNAKVPITAVEARDVGDTFTAVIALKVKNKSELNKIISLIASINGVRQVSRSEGWK